MCAYVCSRVTATQGQPCVVYHYQEDCIIYELQGPFHLFTSCLLYSKQTHLC